MTAQEQANYHSLVQVPAVLAKRDPETGEYQPGDAEYRWSGRPGGPFAEPPAIGTRVLVTMNRLGCGEVVGYFAEYGWFGVLVALEDAPAWHRKQRNNDPVAHIFGAELAPLEPVAKRFTKMRVPHEVNGYEVIQMCKLDRGAVVICDKRHEFVCWMLDDQGNAFWGVYGDLEDAEASFNARIKRIAPAPLGWTEVEA